MDHEIRLGYACLNMDLRESDIFTSRSLILKTAHEKGLEYIQKLIMENLDDLLKILIYNEAHGIRFYRMSSCIFPHLGNPKLDFNYELDFVKDKLKMIGKYAKKKGHRLTMHPGQFVQLGSPNPEVVGRSIVDLENHAQLLKMLGYSPTDGSVMIIHGGGTFGNKEETLKRWKENFLKIPTMVRNYISLENDEIGYGINDLLPVCEELGIPFCLDIFHNRVSKNKIPITKRLIKRIHATWKHHSGIPKIHVSEQQIGLRTGAHSKTIDELPLYLFRLPNILNSPLDIMLEVKDKEMSVFKMYYKYFDIKMASNGRITYVVKKKIEIRKV